MFSFRPEEKSRPTKRSRDRGSSTIDINNVQSEITVSCATHHEEELKNVDEDESKEESNSKCPVLRSFFY
jgi:hypothetical protein